MRIIFMIVSVAAYWVGLIAPATATLVSLRYSNGSVLATATLDVENGQAISGSGAISGGGLIGTLPMTYIFPNSAPLPLTATPASDCIAGALGCYDVGVFSCGCAFVDEDTVFNIGSAIPIDTDGIAFQVGGAALNYGFALYDAGDGTVGEILAGDAPPQPSILIPGQAGGALQFEVPEPDSAVMLATGVFGLSCFRWAARRRKSVLGG